MELEKEGDHERSLANFSGLQKDASPYVPAFFMAAQQLVKLNRINEARDALRRGIEEARRQNNGTHAAGEMSELFNLAGQRRRIKTGIASLPYSPKDLSLGIIPVQSQAFVGQISFKSKSYRSRHPSRE